MENCQYFSTKCSNCQWINLSYQEQLDRKTAELEHLFPVMIKQVFVSEHFEFRDKAKLQISGTLNNPIIGFLHPQSLKVEEEILECPIHHHQLNQSLNLVKSIIPLIKLVPYEVSTRTGELKGIIIFHSPTTQEKYIRFVLRSTESILRIKKHLHLLNEFDVISANIQPIPHAILEGPEEIILSEKSFINHQFNSKIFFLATQSFVQTNSKVAEKLYFTASQWVKNLSINKILDLYCGVGTFALHLASKDNHVMGVEINKAAINMAKENAKIQNQNVNFICEDASKIDEMITSFNPDLLVVNPPRSGIKKLTTYLNDKPVKYILYSSCNQISFMQDFKQLEKIYQIEKMAMFDMFPYTPHYELLCLLKLKNSSS